MGLLEGLLIIPHFFGLVGQSWAIPSLKCRRLRRILPVVLLLGCIGSAVGANETLPFLQVGAQSYTNVVVTGKTATDIFIRHAQGMATVKVRHLDSATRARLGYPAAEPFKATAMVPTAPQLVTQATADAPTPLSETRNDPVQQLKRFGIPLLLLVIGLQVLKYLTRSKRACDDESTACAEGSPDLKSIIASNRPLKSLKELFPYGITDSSLMEYGKARHRRHTGAEQSHCEICHSTAVSQLQAYRWITMVQPKFTFTSFNFLMLFFGRIGITLQQTEISFETAHCVCQSCAVRTRIRRMLSVVAKGIAFFVLLLSLAVTVMGGGSVVYDSLQGNPVDHEFLWLFFAGLGGLFISWLGHKCERSLRIPSPFRSIGLHPFWLSRVYVIRKCESRVPVSERAGVSG